MNLTAISTIAQAVAKGAAYLDSRYPGWRWRIDLPAFDFMCEVHSITGQLFGESLADQLRGVGIDPDSDSPWVLCQAFSDMGFSVMVAEAVEIPAEVRATMKAAVDQLAALVGPDYSAPEVPTVIPVPRDMDVVRIEVEGLQHAWERELAKR